MGHLNPTTRMLPNNQYPIPQREPLGLGRNVGIATKQCRLNHVDAKIMWQNLGDVDNLSITRLTNEIAFEGEGRQYSGMTIR